MIRSLRPFRILPLRKRPTSSILPLDPREESAQAELRNRRARASASPFNYGRAHKALETGLLAFADLPPQNDAQRAAMLALGTAYSAGLSGPAQDDRIALVLWWCALIEAERAS